MRVKIEQLISEITAQKENAEVKLNEANNLPMIYAHTVEVEALSLCIAKIETIFKEELKTN